MRTLFAICLILVLSSCQKDGGNIAAGLQPYYDSFLAEAAAHNYTIPIDKEDIIMLFTDIPSESVIGQCNHNTEQPDVVEIDRFLWETFDEPTREFVIFHELGHCILDRGHKDSVDGSGNCISLMHSRLGLCKFEFTGVARDEYIDELFNF